jgi:hypothetical protein
MMLASSSSAQAQSNCPPWRPCGAGNSWGGNRLVPQGFYGADFRPACLQHDTCELSDRQCDRQFLGAMYSACETSTHPALCRMKARRYYLASRIWHTIPKGLRPTLSVSR